MRESQIQVEGERKVTLSSSAGAHATVVHTIVSYIRFTYILVRFTVILLRVCIYLSVA